MAWGREHITKQAFRTAPEDYAAFEAINLAGRENVRVLDVGCFDGFNTRLKFAPYDSIARVVGIDPSADDIARAVAQTDDARFLFVHAAFEDFEPEDGAAFDVVYFSHVLQHVRDPQAALAKAYRLLAPGGFVVVKTTDDSVKLSYPDPSQSMKRLFALYDEHVRPNTAWTACTDRCNGQKCYTYLVRAGFSPIRVKTFSVDTVGKAREERLELFERFAYFRRNVPSCVDTAIANEIHALLDEWKALFESDEYYFSSESFVAIGQKPDVDRQPWTFAGDAFGDGRAGCAQFSELQGTMDAEGDALLIRPMVEDDLAGVMAIEAKAFQDPWTPLAYALELRHNPCAHYEVACALSGGGSPVACDVTGYLGWWEAGDTAAIVRVAVDPCARRGGCGTKLVKRACQQAAARGCRSMQLEVRASNESARAFYRRLGFRDVFVREGFYDFPADDAVVMAKELEP